MLLKPVAKHGVLNRIIEKDQIGVDMLKSM
jgi:hypothetical protein